MGPNIIFQVNVSRKLKISKWKTELREPELPLPKEEERWRLIFSDNYDWHIDYILF